MGKTKPCRYCGKPTSLKVKLISVDLVGREIQHTVPAHKKCMRPEFSLPKWKGRWSKIGKR